MKKFMTVMLALSFVLGAASIAFGDDAPTTKKTTKAKKAKAKKTTAEKQ